MARPAIVPREPVALDEDELVARVFRALGEPNRLRVLEVLLEEGQRTQSELIEQLGLTQSRASEHLACLVWCGFVVSERRGRTVVYRVADSRTATFVELGRAFVKNYHARLGSCQVLGQNR